MDFTLNEIQQELKEQARAWLSVRYPLDRDWEGQDDRWSELEELGWLDVAAAELGFVEEALLLEEMGYALYPGPYLAHVTGLKDAFGPGGTIVTVDPTRPLHRLAQAADETPRFRAGAAAEAVGIAQRALELGIQHASTRTQFGKPIGAYQAVSHPLADTYTDVELARSLAYWAAWCIANDDAQAAVAAAAAKAFATEAAVAACERSIQVHGGTGFTWEHPLHRFYKRALWLEGFGKRPAQLRAEVADAILGVAIPA
ncbi:MAG TPA: acyl-CoA dehydrogenase family protein [Gaiellaceae bacterium]|nr:acyl-CoA dehydrogenase family protein [Gaiellaceae bacterium]